MDAVGVERASPGFPVRTWSILQWAWTRFSGASTGDSLRGASGLANACSVREPRRWRVRAPECAGAVERRPTPYSLGRLETVNAGRIGNLSLSPCQPHLRKTWSHEENDAHGKYFEMLVIAESVFQPRGLGIRIVCSQSPWIKDAEQLLAP